MDTAAITDIKAQLKIDATALQEIKMKIQENLPQSESKSLAKLTAANKVTSGLMENPPSCLPDEAQEKIKTVSVKVSDFSDVAEKCGFLLDKVDKIEESMSKAAKELQSLNAQLKKLRGEGCSKMFLACTMKSTVQTLNRQLERLEESMDQLKQSETPLEEKLETYLSEEAQKAAEEEAAKALEQDSEGLMDKLASALGVTS